MGTWVRSSANLNDKQLLRESYRKLPEASEIQGQGTMYDLWIIWHVHGVSKKALWKFNRLSCILNVAKQFNFYIGRKNSYLALQWYSFYILTMRNGHIYSSNKNCCRVEITFFHRWELHGKRNMDNSQEGIKIEC